MRLRSECLHHGRYSRAERENSHRALEHLSIRNHGALLLAVYRNRAFDQAHLDSPNRVARVFLYPSGSASYRRNSDLEVDIFDGVCCDGIG
jgi:hypothetical protein